MLSEEQFLSWCRKLKLSPQACELVSRIRSSQPSRRVQSARGNVSGRYPSRKMGWIVQAESHIEMAAVREMEHDIGVHEYYDQPPQIKLSYKARNGKPIGFYHTPDYFVLREEVAGWEECKTEEELVKLAEKEPNRYLLDESEWRCPPGEKVAEGYGLYYRVLSSKSINWIFQRNIQFLDDYLRAEALTVTDEARDRIHLLVSREPGISLKDLLGQEEVRPDDAYTLIGLDFLYVDLYAACLAEPERVRLFPDEETATAYERMVIAAPFSSHGSRFVELAVNTIVEWDGKAWTILNVGTTTVSLLGDSNEVIELPLPTFEELAKDGRIKGVASQADSTRIAEIKHLIISASKEDLRETNRRAALAIAYLQGAPMPDEEVSKRTVRAYATRYRTAEIQYGCGYLGLFSQKRMRGNRTRRMPEATIELLKEFIEKDYETLKQKRKTEVYASFLELCERRGMIAPSYKTFISEVKKRPRYEQILKRQGRRAAYQHQSFYWALDQTTPRHGDRPFEICHVDHTQLDIELICSTTRRNLGRPWATILTDAYSRRFLAVVLSFDPPSYRACMVVLRECVRRHGRFPQSLVVDGGKEFASIYFETLLARYECTKRTRPPAQARFGSVCERLFGTLNTRFIHNLRANTQIMRNVRQVTKSVNPKNQAVWTFSSLHAFFCEFAYELYDTTDHPALGQSPREAFAAGTALAGMRPQRLIPYDENFLMFTRPTTRRGTAKVSPGRGVKVNYLFYWCDAFRDPAIENTWVEVRHEPYDAGIAYAFVRNQWQQCISQYYAIFHGRSEREIMLASKELLKRRKQHSEQFNITAKKLAGFLRSVEDEEAILTQRLRDKEASGILEKANSLKPHQEDAGMSHSKNIPGELHNERAPDEAAIPDTLVSGEIFGEF